MTIEINEQRKARALHPPSQPTGPVPRCSRIVIGVRAFTILAGLASVTLATLDIHGDGSVHLSIPAATCFVITTQGVVLVLLQAMFADRHEFYRRGQLDGWMRGWRGQEPEVDDTLLHR